MANQDPKPYDAAFVRRWAAAHNFEATPEKIEALFESKALSWRDGRVVARYPATPENGRLAELLTESAAYEAARPQPQE